MSSSSSTPMTTGAAVRSIKRRSTTTWSDLPEDLLAMVYCKLTSPIPHDRLSFAATCRSWRGAAAIALPHPAPPALPWLIYGGNGSKKRSLYIPQDNAEILSIWLPTKAVGKRFTGLYDGGWVATLGNNRQLTIVNLFSGVQVPLSSKQRRGPVCGHQGGLCIIEKIIFSESPTSGTCILAAFIHSCSLAICRVGCPDSGWTTKHLGGATPTDIAFCNGELYGLRPHNELAKFQVGARENGVPMVTVVPRPMTGPDSNAHLAYPRYIVELHGKIALVVKTEYRGKAVFKVFELGDETMRPYRYKWMEVTSLGDYALFLGGRWSKAVYVPMGGRGVVQRNYIYAADGVYFMSSTNYGGSMYHMQPASNGLQMVQGLARCYEPGSPQTGMWLLPPGF